MNDVNRHVAWALGVAVIGSVSRSLYSSKVDSATTGLPHGAAHTATDSVGGAAAVAAHLPAGAGDALTAAAHGAFTDAIGLALPIGTGVMLTPSERRTSNSSSPRSPISLRRTRASPSVTTSSRDEEEGGGGEREQRLQVLPPVVAEAGELLAGLDHVGGGVGSGDGA